MKPQNIAVLHVWLRVALAALVMALIGGVFAGFVPLKPVLYDFGVYKQACPNITDSTRNHQTRNSTDVQPLCDAQAVAVNRIIQTASGGVNLLSFPLGGISDKLRRRNSALLGSSVSLIGFISFMLCVYFTDNIVFGLQLVLLPALLLLCACGGVFLFFATMTLMGDMMKHSAPQANMVNAVLTGAWDLSAFVLAGMSAGYFFLGWNPLYFAIGLSAGSIPLVALLAWKIYPPESEDATSNIQQDHSAEPPKEQVNPFQAYGQVFKRHPVVIVSTWLALGVAMTVQYWYLSTLLEQLLWVTGSASDAAYYNGIFSIFLPIFGSVPNLLLSFLIAYSSGSKTSAADEPAHPFDSRAGANESMPLLHEKISHSSWRGYAFLFVAAVAFTVLSVIRFGPLLYATFIIYCIWRMFTFITLYQFVGEHFPPEIFGTASAAALSVGGLMTLLNYGLNPLTVFTFGGNYLPVNVTVGLLAIFLNLVMAILSWRFRHSKLSSD